MVGLNNGWIDDDSNVRDGVEMNGETERMREERRKYGMGKEGE